MQRQFDRLGAVEDRVRDQLARDQAQDSCRTVERPLRDELFDKATRKKRTLHVVRQRQNGARHGGRFLDRGVTRTSRLEFGGPCRVLATSSLPTPSAADTFISRGLSRGWSTSIVSERHVCGLAGVLGEATPPWLSRRAGALRRLRRGAAQLRPR